MEGGTLWGPDAEGGGAGEEPEQVCGRDDDDIYIMMKCLYVCMSVTFLLILPFPCHGWPLLCAPASHLPPGLANNLKSIIIMMNVDCLDADD